GATSRTARGGPTATGFGERCGRSRQTRCAPCSPAASRCTTRCRTPAGATRAGRRCCGPSAIASSVRAARVDDFDRIAAIKVQNWADTYAPLLSAETLRPFLDQAAQRHYIKEKA